MTTKYFDVKKGLKTGNIILDAETANITGVNNANLGNLVIANFFSGAGNLLSNIQGANVSGAVASANTAATVTDNAQPNITSVGTLTSLSITGNLSAGNANLGNLVTANFFSGDGGLLTNVAASGSLSNGNSNVSVPTANGNVTISVAGNANVAVFTGTGVNVTGYLTASGNLTAANATLGNLATANFFAGDGNGLSNIQGANVSGTVGTANTVVANAQPNITSVGTLTSLDVTGNITGGNANLGNAVTANFFIGSGANLSNINGANVTGTVANATHASTANTVVDNAQPNITSVGTLTSLDVTGNITGGNANLGNAVTANFFIGSGANLSNINGANVTGTVANATHAATANTVVDAAQPNITSVGTLTSLDVTGNVTGGNLVTGGNVTANFITANSNLTANAANIVGTLTAANLVANALNAPGTGDLYLTAGTGNANIILTPSGNGTVSVGNFRITQLAEPVAATDAATKLYVDTVAEGLHIHASVIAATPATLATISGGTITYNNGTAGVGATLTTTGTFGTIDGVNVASSGSRILVKNEANAAHNGIYTWTSATVLTRATDFDTGAEIQGGDFVFCTGGTLYNSTQWVQIDEVVTVGTDPIVWEQFGGAGTYNAGAGLTLTGTTFSVNVDNVTTAIVSGNVVVKANAEFITPNIGAATGTSLDLTGNFSANNITSNTNLNGNVANFTGNITAANGNLGNLVTANFVSGTLTTAAQPNITSIGTLSSLDVTGNVIAGNVYANSGTIGASLLTGTLTTAAQPNVTSVGNLTSLKVDGVSNLGAVGNVIITGGSNGQVLSTNGSGNLSWISISSSSISNGNSNVSIPAANGNINLSAAGNANVLVVTGTGANVNGDLSVTGNVNANNFTVGSGSGGNVSGANVISANTFIGNLQGTLANGTSNVAIPAANGNVTISAAGNANIAVFTGTGVNVAGTLNATGNANVGNLAATDVTATTLGGTLTTAAQPNITSVGTLSGLTSGGIVNFTTSSNVSLGAVANVKITGGSNGQFLQTDGTGNLVWADVEDTSLSNGNSNISIAANSNISMSVAGNANILVVTGTGVNVAGTINASGNANVGNLGATDGVFTGNVSAANFYGALANGTSNVAIPAANGNVNITAGGNTTVVVKDTGANVTGTLGVSGNANVGNIGAASGVFTANVSANNVNVTNNVVTGNVKLNVGLTSNRANVSVSTNTVVDQFAPGTFRTAKYIISASGDDGFQSVETLLVHDGTNSYITIYGSICSNNIADIIELSSNVNGTTGNVTVYATSNSANALVNVVATYIQT